MNHEESYRRIFDSRSADEMRMLAQVKRFLECVIGDDEFRDELKANLDDPRPVVAARGIDADPRLMRPLFQHGLTHLRFENGSPDYPLAMAWDRYIGEMLEHRDRLAGLGSTAEAEPHFERWRQRQMRRVQSECGDSASSITHPLVAFELSEGCSVGCWFCGISADKFRGAWPYDEKNAALWKGVLAAMMERFGAGVQSGFLYWATDPMDNPDYARFLADFRDATGYLAQTTTAAPLKEVARTREVLDLFWQHRSICNRFSILNKKMLRRVHEEFTADELMPVELVLQNKEALMSKAGAGRARERREKLRSAGRDDRIALRDGDHQTIACVSGFLVSMPRGTVELVTPTRPSDRWPKGYKVLSTRFFDSVASFERAMDSLLRDEIEVEPQASSPARFRPDLDFEATESGFFLHSSRLRHRCNSMPFSARLGELLEGGDRTYGSVLTTLVEEGEDLLLVRQALEDLWESGVLCEGPDARSAAA